MSELALELAKKNVVQKESFMIVIGRMIREDTVESWISIVNCVRENSIPNLVYKRLYEVYLGSKTWKNKRQRVRERDNFQCQECDNPINQRLHTHHLTYERVFWERLEDLLTLCKDCHNNKHNV